MEKEEQLEEIKRFLILERNGYDACEQNQKYKETIAEYITRLQKNDSEFEYYVSVIGIMRGVQIIDFQRAECLIVADCERTVRDFMRRIPNGVEMTIYFDSVYYGVITDYIYEDNREKHSCYLKGLRKADPAVDSFCSRKDTERIIVSKKDEIVSELKKLTTLKSRIETGHVVMEGFLLVSRALKDHLQVEKVVYADDIEDEQRMEIIHACEESGIPYYRTGRGMMSAMTTTTPVPEVMCSVRIKAHTQNELIISKKKNFFLVLDGIANPDNLGMVLRTADASGVDAVILLSPSTHHFNKNAIRGARGAVGRIPIYHCNDDFALMKTLQEHHFKILGTSARFEASNFYDVCYSYDNIAVIVGNESNGVRKEILDRCTDYVKIPMVGGQSSLNVAVAAALVLYEYDRELYQGENKGRNRGAMAV